MMCAYLMVFVGNDVCAMFVGDFVCIYCVCR